MKNILIINGHPYPHSLCNEIAKRYKIGADNSDHTCKIINLHSLNFNPNLESGYHKRTELEPDLIQAQEDIKNAHHLVFIFPTWWGTYPAIMKGFIDRVFLPKYAFKYRKDSLLWDKLLKGKSARIVTTMDTPVWYYKLIYKSPGSNSFKKNILNFCGISPVKTTIFSPVKTASANKIGKWLDQIEYLGLSGI